MEPGVPVEGLEEGVGGGVGGEEGEKVRFEFIRIDRAAGEACEILG